MENEPEKIKVELKKLVNKSFLYRKIAIGITLLTVLVSVAHLIYTQTVDPFLILQLALYLIAAHGVYNNNKAAIIGLIILTVLATGLKFFFAQEIIIARLAICYLVVWNLYKAIVANKMYESLKT